MASKRVLPLAVVILLLACSPLVPFIGDESSEPSEDSSAQAPGDSAEAEPTVLPTPYPTLVPVPSTPSTAARQPTPVGAATLPLNPNPPAQPIKLAFVHHSTGENWLRDGNGNLGRTLGSNNYFVSDTNYGWGPDGIGDRTDIVNWLEWFRSPQAPEYLAALYAESGQNSEYTRTLSDPGGENEIIMIKSCFPNSNLEGTPADPPARGDGLTVSNAKFIYNELLAYFATRPDKLFVVITAPPVTDGTWANNARAFNRWLVQDWRAQNQYSHRNVVVFDFYNILTSRDAHHRYRNGTIEYLADPGRNTTTYASAHDDDHPSAAGNQKATAEFVPFLDVAVHCWRGDGGCPR